MLITWRSTCQGKGRRDTLDDGVIINYDVAPAAALHTVHAVCRALLRRLTNDKMGTPEIRSDIYEAEDQDVLHSRGLLRALKSLVCRVHLFWY